MLMTATEDEDYVPEKAISGLQGAEHLKIFLYGLASLRPRLPMIALHIFKFIDCCDTGIREIPPTEIMLKPELLRLVGDGFGRYSRKS